MNTQAHSTACFDEMNDPLAPGVAIFREPLQGENELAGVLFGGVHVQQSELGNNNLSVAHATVLRRVVSKGTFFGTPDEMDPLVGPHDGSGRFTIPQQPIRRRLSELPRFVVNRGGEYCFTGSPTSTPDPRPCT
jgi:hypothetical protein